MSVKYQNGGGDILTKLDLRPPSPITFWKSPYARDGQSLFKRSTLPRAFHRPKVSVIPTKYGQQVQPNENTGKVVVKSILKQSGNKDNVFGQKQPHDENTPRILYAQPNLITTGTGSGRPHGVLDRSNSAEKRVKFDRLPKPTSAALRASSSGSFHGGRKISSRRHIPGIRQLGSGLLNYRTPAKYSTVVSLSGGETQIKNQIDEFIKKLRMSEANKLAKMTEQKEALNVTASKLRKTRSLANNRYFHDWKEFDLDSSSLQYAADSDPDRSDAHLPDETGDANKHEDDQLSDGESISSTTLDFDGKHKPIKAKPNVTLNTKYRHITMNEANLHKYDDRYQNLVLGRDVTRLDSAVVGKSSLSFCNPQKASDIIGWLADVENAKVELSQN